VQILLNEAVLVLQVVHDGFDPHLTAAELLPDIHDLLDADIDAEDGVHGIPDAFFDPFGNLHLPLPAEEGDHSHFPEIHLDGIAGFSRHGHQTEEIVVFRPHQLLRGFFHDQLFTLVRIDDIDVLLPEKHDYIVNLIRRDDVRRQHVIYVVIGQKALLLSQGHKFLELLGMDVFTHKNPPPYPFDSMDFSFSISSAFSASSVRQDSMSMAC